MRRVQAMLLSSQKFLKGAFLGRWCSSSSLMPPPPGMSTTQICQFWRSLCTFSYHLHWYRHRKTTRRSVVNYTGKQAGRWSSAPENAKCRELPTNVNSYILKLIREHKVNVVEAAKYLAVSTINKNLRWYIDNITKKANSIKAFIQRNLQQYQCNSQVSRYSTLVL